ncbi:hypothetical protein ALP57_200107 [Pseudomonas coronafaciens pv. oryzae]|nr:hypothetical protein ALP57_200107 [Pseudomonas coronafaciens pv. oryzae]
MVTVAPSAMVNIPLLPWLPTKVITPLLVTLEPLPVTSTVPVEPAWSAMEKYPEPTSSWPPLEIVKFPVPNLPILILVAAFKVAPLVTSAVPRSPAVCPKFTSPPLSTSAPLLAVSVPVPPLPTNNGVPPLMAVISAAPAPSTVMCPLSTTVAVFFAEPPWGMIKLPPFTVVLPV